ncbi:MULTISPECIES: tetratricopeptide repeat protein [unclassified Aureispira]|uniref:tetratricopeptide repeat protein n=1 Tax=unclassified Aureispira TaxID=2649989 RepID=UPI00069638F6|nr:MULTISPECIES: tetratricopeptide repeat protein [unclassified Aureispira]WMX15051.1 tetratricopeptide repeat protein [Aureispira sp. CCB-E]
MEAHDYDGEHQPDLKLLVQRYEGMLKEGGISFLEVDSFLMLSDYYEEGNDFKRALVALNHAMNQHPYSASLYVRKAQILSEQERYDQAFEALEAAVIYEPSDLDIYLTQADIYMRMFDQDNAIRVIQKAKEYASREELGDLYVLESTIYETKKDYDNALKYLKLALRKDPNNEIALSRISGIYDQTKDYGDAITFHLNFINQNPYSYWAWYNLGLAYLYVGLIEKAAEAFDYAIVINERFEPAYHYYIDCLIGLEQFDAAMRYLSEYLDLFDADPEIWYRLGQCYEHQGNYEKARSYYTQTLQYNSLNGRVYHSIGNCYIEEDEWYLAEKAFLQAYAVDKFNEEFCLSLADTYDALENSDKAHEFYHKALAIEPKEVSIWIHYIEFLIDEESYAVAIEMLDEARQYIEDILLDFALAAVLIESGQRQEGFVVLGQALMEDYNMHTYIYQIAPRLADDASVTSFILQYKNES